MHEESERTHPRDQSGELFAELGLHERDLLDPHRIPLGFHGDPLTFGCVPSQAGERTLLFGHPVRTGLLAQAPLDGAVNREVGISPNG